MPLAYAVGNSFLGGTQAALFGAFGAFAALGFCNFGGPPRRRTLAYLWLVVATTPLVVIGTVVSDTTVAAAILTALVTFVAMMAETLGTYWEAARSATILSFVLAVAVEAPDSQIGDRVLGWVFAGLLSAVLALVLFPSVERYRIRRAIADVLERAATGLTAAVAERDAALTALDEARAELHALTGISFRPVGAATHDRALKVSAIGAERIGRLVHVHHERPGDTTPADELLAAETAATLVATAGMLRALPPATPVAPELAALEQDRVRHHESLDEAARADAGAGRAAAALQLVDRSFPLRRLSLLALATARNGALAVGIAAPDVDAPGSPVLLVDPALRGTASATEQHVRAHLNLRSVRFRNAVRAAVGLAVAMTIAKVSNVEHGFWVVLGTLSVLRSNALGTQRSAMQAIVGTVIGFGVASALMETVGSSTVWLWVLFPLLTFLTAYTPGAVNFMVGQACFTVLVVDLFNLSIPEGWRTGLVRVQDIAIGVSVSIVVGFVLWPRGAEGVVRRAFAEMLGADADAFDDAIDRMAAAGGAGTATREMDQAAAKRREAAAARGRVLVALEVLASERGVEQADRSPWSDLLVLGTGTEWAAEGIVRDSTASGHRPAVGAAGDAAGDEVRADVVRHAREVAAALRATAGTVLTIADPPPSLIPPAGPALPPASDADDDADRAPDEQLAADLTRCVQEGGELPVDLLWSREWILHVERLLHVQAITREVRTP